MKSQTGPPLGQLSQPRPPPQGTVLWFPSQWCLRVLSVCLLNKMYQEKRSANFPIHCWAGSKFSVLLKQIPSYSTAVQKVGWKFDIEPVDTGGKSWLRKTRPLELALEQDSGTMYIVFAQSCAVTSVKKLWEDASVVRLGTDINVAMPGSLIICPGVPMSARAQPQFLLTAKAGLTYVAWSEQEVWPIVLMYTGVMKHRDAPWVARSHQPLFT